MTFNVNAVKSKRRDGVQIQLLPQNEIGCNRSQAVEQKVQILILKQYSIEPEGVYGKRDEKTRGRQYSGPVVMGRRYMRKIEHGRHRLTSALIFVRLFYSPALSF
jgi:hypothetical protein